MLNDDFRQALENGDIDTLLGIWSKAMPHLPLPDSRDKAEFVMHYARTVADSISFKKRAYSHAWLSERGLRSGLPDELKKPAERLYPITVGVVGISVNIKSEILKPIGPIIQGAMGKSVLESYADGVSDPDVIKRRMFEAKKNETRKLLGSVVIPKK